MQLGIGSGLGPMETCPLDCANQIAYGSRDPIEREPQCGEREFRPS